MGKKRKTEIKTEVEVEVEAEAEANNDEAMFDEEIEGQQQEPENQNEEAPEEPANINNHEEEEEEEEETDSESLTRLLEPFSKDQLIELLRQAALQHSDVFDSINKVADVDPAHRKIFVHGLGWDTTAEILISTFKKYGEIEDCNAVADKHSGKSKGYGFILFKHRSGARKALKQPQKRIGNRMTACQLASAGPVPQQPPVSEYTMRKIYVSNVSSDIDPQRLYTFFSKYGEIEEGPLGLDKQTGKPRGFSLFVYKSLESARKALEDPHKNFEGHILHCQKAIDGPKPNKPTHHAGQAHHHPHHQNQHHNPHYPQHHADNMQMMNQVPAHGASHGGLMAPSQGSMPFNQAAGGLNPALGQALNALLASQGAGFGLQNVLASLNPMAAAAALNQTGLSPNVNQSVPAAGSMVNNASHGAGMGGYGGQGGMGSGNMMGGYGSQGAVQGVGVGGYQNAQMGQPGSGVRAQQGVGAMGGVTPYIGH